MCIVHCLVGLCYFSTKNKRSPYIRILKYYQCYTTPYEVNISVTQFTQQTHQFDHKDKFVHGEMSAETCGSPG